MDAILIFLASFGATVLANRLGRRGRLAWADVAGAVLAACLGVGIAQILGAEGAGRELGLPLLIAFCLPLGLQSFQDRPARR